MLDELSSQDLTLWKQEYDAIAGRIYIDAEEKISELQWLYGQLQNRISPILWGLLKEQPTINSSDNIFIDRLDEVRGAIRVVNYKTGMKKDMRFKTVENLFDRTNEKRQSAIMQVFTYAQ